MLDLIERGLRHLACFYFFCLTVWLVIFEYYLSPILAKLLPQFYENRPKGQMTVNQWLTKTYFESSYDVLGINQVVTYDTPPYKDKACIVMFSHGSNLDIFTLYSSMPQYIHFITKQEHFKIPFLRTALILSNQVPIDRSNLNSAIGSLNQAGEMIRNKKQTIAISPEGTRRRSYSTGTPDQFLPFKKGPFHLAKNTGVDVIPVLITGAHRLWPPGQLFSKMGTIFVEYCNPISAEVIEKKTIEEVQALVKEEFTRKLKKIDDKVIFSNPNKKYGTFILGLILNFLTLRVMYSVYRMIFG